MKLEEMFKYCTDQEMAVEMIDKLNKTNMIKGIKYTDLKYSIRDAIKKFKNAVVIIDTIPSLSIYYSINSILLFVNLINIDIKIKNYTVLWVSINNPQEKNLNNAISNLCDKVLVL